MRIINEPDGTISSASNRNIHKLEWRGNSGWWGTLKMHTVQFDLSVIKEDWVQCHHIPPQHRKAVVQLMSGPHCLAYRWLSNNWWDFYAPPFFSFFLFVFCYGDWNITFRLFSLMKLHLSAAHQRLTLTWGTVQVFAQACENSAWWGHWKWTWVTTPWATWRPDCCCQAYFVAPGWLTVGFLEGHDTLKARAKVSELLTFSWPNLDLLQNCTSGKIVC